MYAQTLAPAEAESHTIQICPESVVVAPLLSTRLKLLLLV